MVPAGVVTVLRGRWLLFFFGWLTLGALWFVGALIPDDRTSERERRLASLAIAGIAVAFLVLGVFGARPAPLLGMNGTALQNSVGGIFGLAEGESCEREGEVWVCSRYHHESSGSVSYRVRVDGQGCWDAIRVGNPRERDRKVSGCAGLADYVFN